MRTSGLTHYKESVVGLLNRKFFAESKQGQNVNTRTDFNLSQGQVESVRQMQKPNYIECHEGRIWITESCHPYDIILQKGESHEFVGNGVIVIEALLPAKVALKW